MARPSKSPSFRRKHLARWDALRAAAQPVRCGIEPLESRVLLASTPFYGTPFQLASAGTTIQAEDFDKGGEAVAYHDRTTTNDGGAYRPSEGVDIETTTDTGGGYDVCFIKAGEWMNYSVNAPTTGSYNFAFRVSSAASGGTFHVEVDGVNATGTLNLPGTGGAQTWTTITKTGVQMTAGQHIVRVVFDTNNSTTNSIMGSMNWMQVTAPTPPPTPTVTIAATSPNASETGPTNGVFTVTRSGDTSAALTVPVTYSGSATSGSDYQTAASSVTIPAGQTSAQLVITPIDDTVQESTETVIATIGSGAGYTLGGQTAATVNIADNDSPPPPGPTPFGGTPWAVPTTIEAENYDVGGEGISYHDTTANNEGGAYRTGANEGVDVEPASDLGGGYDVGFAHAGEWLGYTINVATAGTYSLNARVANLGAGGGFHLEVDGQAVTPTIAIPDTGGFQKWTTITYSGFNLTAGQHFLKVVMDGNSQYGYTGNFNFFQFAFASGQPVVNVVATTPNASESGPTNGVFTFTRTGSTAAPLTVDYAVSGSATSGTDYASITGPVTIPAGATSATVTVVPVDDQLVEGPESVLITLQNNGAYTKGAQSTATVTIADNDVASGNPTPFSGTPSPIPGVIEFENFDNGGEGVAYHDTTSNNEGLKYRTADGVDIESTTDTGGGYDVGYAHTGEWLGYTTSVATAGTYNLSFRVSNYGAGGAFHVEVDGQNVTGTLAVPDTNGFQNWTTITKTGVSLTAGQHFVKVVIDGMSQYGYAGNFNWMQFTSVGTPPASTPFSGTPMTVGSTMEAENYDNGGEGIAYHDTTANNEGLQYRTTEGVDIESTTDTGGGFDVGYTHAGEWMNYTITVPTAGSYDLAARVAAGAASGAFHVEFNGVNQTGSLAVPNTGGWQAWTTVTKNGMQLAAGTYVMKVVMDANDQYGFTANFNWFKLTPTPTNSGAQPDLQIRNYGDTAYSGINVINTDGTNQIRGNDAPFLPVIYQIRVVNNGTKADSFNITGTPSDSASWRVWYFDSQVQGNPQTGTPGGNYITDQVTTTGWNTGVLQPGQFKDFRVEAGASPYLPANAQENITVTATSASDPSKVDVVKAVAINDVRREVEVRRRNFATTDGESGTYQLDIQNYGNIADQYKVTATGSGTGYTVKYFDAYSGGNDVTSQVTGAGWTTTPIGFHAIQNMAVQITSTDGKVHSVTFTVKSVADGTVTQTYAIANAAPVAGPSFFPIGVYGMPTWAFDTWKARGANTMVGYDSFGGIDSIDTWTQAAVDRGLYMIRTPRSNVAADANQPFLLGFEQPDEMDLPWKNYPPSTAQATYNSWKAAAPNIPVFANFDGSDVMGWQKDVPYSNYSGYLNAVDWAGQSIYPISGWNRPDDLDVSGRALDRLEALSGGKPQFALIEPSNQKGSWLPPNSPSPTPAQVRAEIWDSIVHGARGIIYFPQSFTPTFTYDNTAPDVAGEITSVNAKITSIGAALESPIDPTSLGFSSSSSALEATWRIYNGKKYYVVLNFSNQTVTNATLTLKGAGTATATVQGESRTVSLNSSATTDTFAPYEAHIYVV